MTPIGWLVNDYLTCIPGTRTFWHNLLEWFPGLVDKTYPDFSILPKYIESEYNHTKPAYIIRNGTYFAKINIPVKTISLIQDVAADKSEQLNIINSSTVTVFNTYYVYDKYKNYITNTIVKICPLGINFDFFKPIEQRHPDVLPNSIIFIGASTTHPKGFNIMLDIISKMTNQNFCLVMKDSFSLDQLSTDVRHRVKIFNRVSQETVRLLINSCICAVCTSYEETQHLSGVECGACNIPIVARKVGFYYDCQQDKDWGLIADDNTFVTQLEYVINNLDQFSPRQYLIQKYSTDICRQNWENIIAECI
uniref:Glycosyl transferase family 1 domain-containing protein n=1 Tax=viral metagenome TaxID=1070528 RepID=A0A6C0JRP6_9ZZZZ